MGGCVPKTQNDLISRGPEAESCIRWEEVSYDGVLRAISIDFYALVFLEVNMQHIIRLNSMTLLTPSVSLLRPISEVV